MSQTVSKTISNDEFAIDPAASRTPDPAYLEHLRKEQQAFRNENTRLGFYRVCSQKACGRAKACVGDGKTCFLQWWPHVHPELKALLRGVSDAYRRGLSMEEARREGLAASEEWNRRFMAGEFSDEARAFLEGPLAHLPPVE
jgi:hypothetical protein